LYFDGHANFAAIVDDLLKERGLDKAKHVLLSGGSAGGIGAFTNVDYLASRLPNAIVKGAPNAGWFFPAALANDLPNVYPPSDWAHFSNGEHGSPFVNGSLQTFISETLYQSRGLIPDSCESAQREGEWWACGSLHILYKYIKAPLFVMEAQYDTNQLYAQEGVPQNTNNVTEIEKIQNYIVMYGEAMRNSTRQILENTPVTNKSQSDGLWHPSCLTHIVEDSVINGMEPLPILGDWFFERGTLTDYYRVVEACNATFKGLPCNTKPSCQFKHHPNKCQQQLETDGCLKSSNDLNACEKCAEKHEEDLQTAGCTRQLVAQLCGKSDE
jgi:hypothetical protein